MRVTKQAKQPERMAIPSEDDAAAELLEEMGNREDLVSLFRDESLRLRASEKSRYVVDNFELALAQLRESLEPWRAKSETFDRYSGRSQVPLAEAFVHFLKLSPLLASTVASFGAGEAFRPAVNVLRAKAWDNKIIEPYLWPAHDVAAVRLLVAVLRLKAGPKIVQRAFDSEERMDSRNTLSVLAAFHRCPDLRSFARENGFRDFMEADDGFGIEKLDCATALVRLIEASPDHELLDYVKLVGRVPERKSEYREFSQSEVASPYFRDDALSVETRQRNAPLAQPSAVFTL